MDEQIEMAIRRMLKTFGVKADAAIQEHLDQNPGVQELRLRIVLQDLTIYSGQPPSQPLHLEVEADIRQS